MTGLSSATLSHLLASYGYWAVFALVALESAGVPLPGETALITAAIYAGTTHNLDITLVIAAAAAGAICGDNVGYWVGRELGAPVLRRYGRYIGLDEGRMAIGQLLFQRHAGKIVVFGRFIALLRVVVALLAGINGMEWRRFFLFNACGSVLWATVYGLAAYALGETIHSLAGPAQLVAVTLGLVAIGVAWIIVRRRAQAAVVRATLAPQERSENPE
jgi:membrane protein DedA with SNARE-associated domain